MVRLILIGLGTAIALMVLALALAFWVVSRGANPLDPSVQLADGRVQLIADRMVASYLIDLDGQSYALIDAGFDTEATAILEALAARNANADAVSAIFFTHGHGDHIAGAARFPNATLYALEPDADLIEGRRTAFSPFARGREAQLTGLDVDVKLADGDIVHHKGVEFEVFALVGHTRGSAAYLVHGVLFLGDSAASTSQGGIVSAPPFFSADLDQAAASLYDLAQRIAQRPGDVEALAFGHQGPLHGSFALEQWAQAYAEDLDAAAERP